MTTINEKSFFHSLSEVKGSLEKSLTEARIKFCQFVGTKEQPGKPRELRDYLIKKLNTFDQTIIDRVPSWIFQEAVDGAGKAAQVKIEEIKKYIHKELEKIICLQSFLHTDEGGHWVQQCATFLCSLPFKVIANILSLLLSILAGSIYAAVHPLKALNELMKLAVHSIYKLTKPKTWSTMGVGMIGTSLGQVLVTGNPLSPIAIFVGALMLTGGLTVGVLSATIKAKKNSCLQAVKEQLWTQISPLPESFITGFSMGLLLGGIQQIFKRTPPVENHLRRALSMVPSGSKQQEPPSSPEELSELDNLSA